MSRFPEEALDNPGRRAEMAALDALGAPQHRTEFRERSIVEGQALATSESEAYLRGHYTAPTGDMYCQACRNPLPFKTMDGLLVLRGRAFCDRAQACPHSQRRGARPLCAALYKYARETKNEALMRQLASTTVEAGQGMVEVPVVLNGKRVKIGFTGKHAIDIKMALGVAGDERESDELA